MIKFPTDKKLDELNKKQMLDELFDTAPAGTIRCDKGSIEVYAGKKWIKMGERT